MSTAKPTALTTTIPHDRIGVLIGSKGKIKQLIEERTGVEISIDSSTGLIAITQKLQGSDVTTIFKARDVVVAMGKGFSPERALRLLDEESVLDVTDLREDMGMSDSNAKRVLGRIIGASGKTRRAIEEMTGAFVSIKGHNVSILGELSRVQLAKEAVQMLIKGSDHAVVYRYLRRKRAEMKKEETIGIWKASK